MKKNTTWFTVGINMEVAVDTIVDGVAELHNDEVFEIIKLLDERMEDWGLTERLAKHFVKLLKNAKDKLDPEYTDWLGNAEVE